MSQNCCNDCVEPFDFPKKINNRSGLSHIDYRIGTYADFLEAMFRELNQNDALKNWTHREPDDPGIALLEGAAVLGDILTFYQELYANEAYLRTAQWRESIADLVRLLGYQLSPGVGGKATFAFKFKGDKSIIVPAKFPLKAQLEPLEGPVDFETTVETVAYPELSQFNLYRPYILAEINNGTNSFSIETAILKKNKIELNKGDRLFLAKSPSNSKAESQIVVIKEIKERFDRTEIEIEGSWQGGSIDKKFNLYAYRIGRSFRHFGHNSPPSLVTAQGDSTSTQIVPFGRKIGSPVQRAIGSSASVQFNSTLNSVNSVNLSQTEMLPLKSAIHKNSRQMTTQWNPGSVAVSVFFNPPDFADVPEIPITSMPLDTEVDDLSVGATLLIQLQLSQNNPNIIRDRAIVSPEYFFERQITAISQTSLTWGAVTAGTSLVEINQPISFGALRYTDIRSIEFLEVIGEKFQLQGAYQAKSTTSLNELFYFGNSQNYKHLHERGLAFVKEDGTHEMLTVNIDETQIDVDDSFKLYPVSLPDFSEDFSITDFPLLDEPKVTVYGNLVPANQGKTEREAVLGNGDSRQKFQTFKLPKAPLTYHNLPGETPPEVPELQIYVSDRLWQRVPSFFNHKPDEEIYIVREDANGDSWVQFGDGKTGKQLPSGIKNVIAKYRTGIGAYGQLKAETKVQASGRLDKLDKIHLPGIVTGGAEPESGENAKEAAPGKIQSLDRLVSLQDFQSETLAIPGVSQALAAWELVDNVPSVVLTVLMETGRTEEFEQVQKILAKYNRYRGPQRFPIQVQEGKRKYVAIAANVAFDPTFRQELVSKAIQAALGVTGEDKGLFSLKNRRFGQPEYATRIMGTIQNVEGVLWVEVTGFMTLGEADDPAELSLPNAIAFNPKISAVSPKQCNSELPATNFHNEHLPRENDKTTMSCGIKQILSLYPTHLQIKPVSPPDSKPCYTISLSS